MICPKCNRLIDFCDHPEVVRTQLEDSAAPRDGMIYTADKPFRDKEAAEERAKEDLANAYRDADFKNNPNGYSVSPYVNSETTSAAFEAGWEARKRWEEEK